MTAYYNEIDAFSAAWLRELIKAGLIAPGDVDERSITDVNASELAGYSQCHFFAGIGGWAYALRLAGWPDDKPVWTGSCPCQPLSVAGQRKGHADQRHLWPTFYGLISERKPAVVFGEQVGGKDGREWFSAVRADLEAAGYACGASDLCAASVGAPHIRQRLYFVAQSDEHQRRQVGSLAGWSDQGSGAEGLEQRSLHGGAGIVADTQHAERRPFGAGDERNGADAGRPEAHGQLGACSEVHKLAQSNSSRLCDAGNLGDSDDAGPQGLIKRRDGSDQRASGPSGVDGFWSDAEWIYCRDGKYRPVEPGPESLADGLADDLGLVRLESYPDRLHEERIIYSPLIQKGKARVSRLRGYGNALVVPLAAEFVRAAMEAIGEDKCPI
jgi:DNA (cytosine-5)-methyltransferase 1